MGKSSWYNVAPHLRPEAGLLALKRSGAVRKYKTGCPV